MIELIIFSALLGMAAVGAIMAVVLVLVDAQPSWQTVGPVLFWLGVMAILMLYELVT